MSAKGVTHYLIPSADEHINEYVPAWAERRAWMSGFTGSAGDLLVGLEDSETFLFADGRYHLQAEQQLDGSGIGVQKVGTKAGKPLGRLLTELAGSRDDALVLGHDPMVMTVAAADQLNRMLDERGARFEAVTPNLVDLVWKGRPRPPVTPLIACPPEWTGQSMADKAARLRDELRKQGADALIAVKLDQIAWFTNLRSTDDIPYNPVFEAFLFVDRQAVHLFLHAPESRIPMGFADAGNGVFVRDYAEFLPFVEGLDATCVSVDPTGATQGVLDALEQNPNVKVVRATSPLEEAKAVKNDAERRCMERANLMASAAKTKALLWLEAELEAGRTVTEESFLDTIEGFYGAIDGYRQLSFNTISSTGEHGAIIHYATADDTPLTAGDLFLIDSGIQMNGGTTDDTRTVTVGTPTDEQRRIYTRVLQAHVAGARHVFPEDVTGAMIDAVVRAPMWADYMNYDHGTGHGVGAFLNVHEGPFALSETRRKAFAVHGLKPGMVTSIEPGYYRAGFGGVRLENLYIIDDTGNEKDGRTWLKFTPLTWIPFDLRLIDDALLTVDEREWLAHYHAECRERLAPLLTDEERSALERVLKE